MNELRPLLIRSPLFPDESLYSYTVRLAELNLYPLAGLLSLSLPYDSRTGRRLDNAFYPKQSQTYDRLAILTQLRPEALYRATPHGFARVLALSREKVNMLSITDGGEQPALTGHRRYTLRMGEQAQFCPVCLKEAAYHRLMWTPVFVLVCLRHRCLLVSRCPDCEQELSTASVVKAKCRRCGAALTQTQVRSVPEDRFGLFAQRTLQAWLEGKPPPSGAWTDSMPNQPPAALYYLATRLVAALLEHVDPSVNWKTQQMCERLTPEVLYGLWTRAFRALVGWPDGLYEFREARTLEALVVDCAPVLSDLTGEFKFRRPLLGGWSLAFARLPAAGADPDILWKQAARRREAKSTQINLRRMACFPHLTLPAAARALGTPQVVVERLVALGRLTGDLASGYVLRADVLKLCRRWTRPMTLAEAASLTGLASEHLIGLVRQKVLKRARLRDRARGVWLARGSVCAFMYAIAGGLRDQSGGQGRNEGEDQAPLDLAKSASIAARFGFTVADVFVLMLKGRLYGCRQAGPLDLGAVRFKAGHLHEALRRFKRK